MRFVCILFFLAFFESQHAAGPIKFPPIEQDFFEPPETQLLANANPTIATSPTVSQFEMYSV